MCSIAKGAIPSSFDEEINQNNVRKFRNFKTVDSIVVQQIPTLVYICINDREIRYLVNKENILHRIVVIICQHCESDQIKQ